MYSLILAGGRGERLRPHTNDRPKPMVILNGKPLIWYHLQWLKENGITHSMVLGGYRLEVIKNYFGDGSNIGMHIEYIEEITPLGRGGAIKNGLKAIPNKTNTIIATNGDVITDQRLAPMIKLHNQQPHTLGTIMLTKRVSAYGMVRVGKDGIVKGFQEKPLLPHWTNAGVYILSREIHNELPDNGDHETTTFPRLAKRGNLMGFRSNAFWSTVDTAKDLYELETLI